MSFEIIGEMIFAGFKPETQHKALIKTGVKCLD
jgi:hypothetical protein